MKQSELPSGGTEGQVIKKSAGTGVEWGEDGGGGDSAYVYIAYASSDDGADFATSPGETLDYIAVLSSETEVLTPEASDFVGLWKKYKGDGFEAGTDGTYGLEVTPNTSTPTAAPADGAAGLRPVASGAWYYYDIAEDEWVLVGSGGSMTYPGTGIPNSTGEAWGTSYGLDTDLSSVSASDDTLASAKAIKAYVDQEMLAVSMPIAEITVPSTNATWVDSLTYTALAGTAQCTAGLSAVEWKLEYGGTYADVTDDGTLGSGEEAWTVPSITLAENDLNTIYIKASGSNSLSKEITRTLYADETDPAVDLAAVHDPANPTTHDGTGTGEFVLDWAETVTEANPASAQWRLIDGATAGEWQSWASPWADVSATLPETTEDVTVELEATDSAGNTGSDTVVVAYSAPATTLFEWGCDDLTAEVFDATDGGTITPGSEGTATYNHDGAGITLASGTWARFTASQGNNIDYSVGSIRFDYTYISGTPSLGTWILAATYTEPSAFLFRRSSTSNTQLVIFWAGNVYTPNVSENIFDTSKHSIIIAYNCAAQTLDLTIDTSTYNISLSATTVPSPATTQRMYLNGLAAGSSAQSVEFDNFKIE